MLPFRRILFPVDYSDAGTAIMPYAKDAVSHFSAEVTLVHAYGPEALGYVDLPITNPEIADRAAQSEQERLQDFAKQNFPGLQVECITALGEPGSVVLDVVRSQGTDLVMLPTHGRGPLRRMLLGSVTAKVLRRSPRSTRSVRLCGLPASAAP